jgi:hypothetical protein
MLKDRFCVTAVLATVLAARQLDWATVNAQIVDGLPIDYEIAELAENFDRGDLTRKQRSEMQRELKQMLKEREVAFIGKCLLEVDGRRYLDGPCNIVMQRDGSFEIGTGERKRAQYFAVVFLSKDTPGLAEGWWNGRDGESHAHTPLGNLSRQGGCWTNARVKVCAWRRGTRPR